MRVRMEGWRQLWFGRKARTENRSTNPGRLLPFLPDGMVTDRSSPSRVRHAAQNAPLTAPGRSAHPPARKEREILGKANQNLLDADRHSHGRPLHVLTLVIKCNGDVTTAIRDTA